MSTATLTAVRIEDHLGLAKFFARQYVSRYGSHAAYDIDDVRQQACIGLCLAAAAFDPGRGVPFSAYARNWLIVTMARGRPRQESSMVTSEWDAIPEPMADIPPVGDGTEREERARAVRALIGKLDPDDAAIIRGRMAGKSLRVIAGELGVSHQTISNRLPKAERALRRIFIESGIVPEMGSEQ